MKPLIFLLAIIWLSAAISGAIYITQLENTPADQNLSYPSAFPVESRLKRDPNRATLIFFAHPKCPCTRASLAELSRLTTDLNGKLTTYIVFIKPKGETDDWTDTSSRAAAEAIPDVQVVIDEDDIETDIFHAQTSGLTLLYDRDGSLRFNGGITAARGHEGDNAGRDTIFQIVASADKRNGESFVFGCPLHKKDCAGELIQN